LAKSVTLYTIDEHWKEHLREMDDLKQSVQNATYEQKDPLLIYKFESFNLFKKILEKISRDVIAFMSRVNIPLRRDEDIPVREEQRKPRTDLSKMQLGRNDLSTNGGEPKSNGPIRVEKKVGRNDPCPCGSGKKYKNCHGKEE
jgi:preprotein translocase subunit SecA